MNRSKGVSSFVLLSASAMIPSKILVYHHPPSATTTEVCTPSRRRRKSLGDLFHKGYRVRSRPAASEKEEPENFWQSLVACCRVCASWGKALPNCSHSPQDFRILKAVSFRATALKEVLCCLLYCVCMSVCWGIIGTSFSCFVGGTKCSRHG